MDFIGGKVQEHVNNRVKGNNTPAWAVWFGYQILGNLAESPSMQNKENHLLIRRNILNISQYLRSR